MSDRARARDGLCGAVFFKYEFLPQAYQIQILNVVADFLAQVIVPIAGAAEGIFFALNFDHRNFAAPITLFFTACADKGLFVCDLPVDKGL